MTPARDDEKRGAVGQLLRWTLAPAFYWLNLQGADGKPSHSKVLATAAFVFGLATLGAFGPVVVGLCGRDAPGCALVLGFYLAYAALVFALPFGLAGYKAWAYSKGGGTVAAFQDIAAKAVAARRAQADGTYEAT